MKLEYRASAYLAPELLIWGEVKVISNTTLVAGDRSNLEVQVNLFKDLPEGYSIEVWRHFVSDMEFMQCDDEEKMNYFECNYKEESIEINIHSNPKVHGPNTFFPYKRHEKVTLLKGAQAGDNLSFKFCNVRLQTYEEKLFNMRFVIMDGDTIIGYLGDANYKIIGGSKQTLKIFAPTIVKVKEAFDCKIVVCDSFGNKSGDPIEDMKFNISLKDKYYKNIVYHKKNRLFIIKDIILDRVDVFYIQVSSEQFPEITGTSNPVIVKENPGEKIYWGDLHQHAYYHDGRGTPEEVLNYGIFTGCLDFGSVCDHVQGLHTPPLVGIPAPPMEGWREVVEAAENFNSQDFVTFFGYEGSSVRRFAGDMNIYHIDKDVQPVDIILGREPKDYTELIEELLKLNKEVLLLPHAHAGGGPARVELPRLPDIQTSVEINSVHGIFEDFYNQWLQAGHRVGVHGGGDNHTACMGNAKPGSHYVNTNGLTAAFSGRKNREEIWKSIKERRTYAVTGNQRIYMDFKIDDLPMGSSLAAENKKRNIAVEAAGTAPILRVELIKNGQVVRQFIPKVKRQRYLRITWSDNFWERRADDSKTEGRIYGEGQNLAIIHKLNTYNSSDLFIEDRGDIFFSTAAYSYTAKGIILQVKEGVQELIFEVEDYYRDKLTIKEQIKMSLEKNQHKLHKPLDINVPPHMKKNMGDIELTINIDWVEMDWPKVVNINWEVEDTAGDYYYLRLEQIDGNFAWSSPIWFD
jgi:hypothetical protein